MQCSKFDIIRPYFFIRKIDVFVGTNRWVKTVNVPLDQLGSSFSVIGVAAICAALDA